MNIDDVLARCYASGNVTLGELVTMSSALWAIVAIRNTKPDIYDEIKKTYGAVLDEINE